MADDGAQTNFTVFGSRGFIGRHVVAYLAERGVSVYAPDRAQIASGEVEARDLGHVIYAIGLTADFRTRLQETVEAHVSLLNRLINGTRWSSWLFLSSTRLYGGTEGSDPSREDDNISVVPDLDRVYDLSKLLGEAICLSRPEETCRVARLSNVFGRGMPGANFIASVAEQASKGLPVTIREDRRSAKDYIPLDDVVRLLYRISLEGKQRSYNVASGSSIDHGRIAELVSETFGVEVGFAEDGALRRFPAIDTSRIQNEFAWKSDHVENALNQFLSTMSHPKDNP